MRYNHIFEKALLLESDKTRFIKDIWEEGTYDPALVMSFTNYKNPTLYPKWEDLITYVNSGAADKLHIDWNKIDKNVLSSTSEFIRLLNGFLSYKAEGGSRKEKSIAKNNDIKQIFFQSGLKTVEGEDSSNAQFAILKNLENDKWIFVSPLTQDAATFCDSYTCGGEGAKWCIGMEDSTYWNDYVNNDSCLFVLAMNKQVYSDIVNKKKHEDNSLKYMIQLGARDGNTQAWTQDDDPDNVIPIEKFEHYFGHSANKIANEVVSECVVDGHFDYASWVKDEDNIGNEEFYKCEQDPSTYYSDLIEKGLDAIKPICASHGVEIDLEGKVFDPSKIKGWPGDAFDIPNFWNAIKNKMKTGSFYNAITIKNGTIPALWYEPEAMNGLIVKVFLENVDVTDFHYVDFSYNKENEINFDEKSHITTLHWPTSENGFYSCSTDSLVLKNEPSYEEYEEDDEQFDESIFRKIIAKEYNIQ